MTWRAEVVTTAGDLDCLEEGWRRHAEARGNAFVTPEWCRTWLRLHSGTAEPYVVAVRDPDEQLRGVLPLVIARRGGIRVAQFAGADCGDFFHPAALEADEERVAEAAARALASARPDWQALVLHHVDERSAWPQRLGRTLERVSLDQGPPNALPYIPLSGETWESLLARRSRNLREQLGRKLRQLERQHTVRFRRTESLEELQRDLPVCFALHDLRWSARGGSSVSSELIRRFHTDFAASALAAGWLRLFFLDVNDQPVAAWYGWSIGGRYSYYLAGFDPQWSRANVGLILLGHTIREAIAEGAREYDMLLGDEPYKLRFAPAARTMRTTVLVPGRSPVRLLVSGDLALRRIARLLPGAASGQLGRAARPLLRQLPLTRRP